LALILRTFITGFSFVIGLGLCTMGGLFIVRQVTSLTTISGNLGARGEGALSALGDDRETAKSLKDSQFARSSYSPSVMFMVGGVLIMGITQALAIPVRSIEIMPPSATAWCLTGQGSSYKICNASIEAACSSIQPTPPPAQSLPVVDDPVLTPLATGE
jgi:hypothetical protein